MRAYAMVDRCCTTEVATRSLSDSRGIARDAAAVR
jgi:hypothetical protein